MVELDGTVKSEPVKKKKKFKSFFGGFIENQGINDLTILDDFVLGIKKRK